MSLVWLAGGFIFGLAGTRHFMGGVIVAVVAVLVHGRIEAAQSNAGQKKPPFLLREQAYFNTIIVLAALTFKSEKKNGQGELNNVESRLLKDYPPDLVKKIMWALTAQLNRVPDLRAHIRIVLEDFPLSSRIQLMHFLIGIATSDGLLTKEEERWLRELAIKIELNIRTFDAILAMFRFRNEYERQKEQPVRRNSAQMLDSAYKILEVEKTATDQEIKKAYRKLAVLHHPDKVAHLGADFQKAANEKFQIIVSAYELIQKERKFV